MKQRIKSAIKIYLFLTMYATLSCLISAAIMVKSKQDFSPLTKIIIGGIGFFLIGFTYGNAIHKKGLLVGVLAGLIHFFLIKGIFVLANNTFDFSWLVLGIEVLLAGIGGILGMNIKKIF